MYDIANIFGSRQGRFVIDKQAIIDIQFLIENNYIGVEKNVCVKKYDIMKH